jgi:hypothetical protein
VITRGRTETPLSELQTAHWLCSRSRGVKMWRHLPLLASLCLWCGVEPRYAVMAVVHGRRQGGGDPKVGLGRPSDCS